MIFKVFFIVEIVCDKSIFFHPKQPASNIKDLNIVEQMNAVYVIR